MTNRITYRSGRMTLAIVSSALLALGAGGIALRLHAHSLLAAETADAAIPVISVVRPVTGTDSTQLTLPGEVRAYTDVPIYARTTGYVKRWWTDLGSQVKAGQLLAELDTPEVDAQFAQAEADLATAEANLGLAITTHARWKQMLAVRAVSDQEYEEKASDLKAKRALRDAASANAAHYRQLQSFKRVVAPFAGIITARNIDTGDLVYAGTGAGGAASQARELFHLIDPTRLRVYVDVPQSQSQDLRQGLEASVTLPERPREHFRGRVVRTAGAVSPDTRTLRVEVDVDNAGGELLGGVYAQVTFDLAPSDPVRLPVNTLLFRSDGLHVAVVSPGRTVRLLPVELGRDFGPEVEVVAGLKGDEQIVLNPPDSIREGDTVRIASPAAAQLAASPGPRLAHAINGH